MDPAKQHKGADDLQQGNEHIFRSMMCKFADVEQVAHQPAHHLSGVVLIIIGKGQTFVLIKKLFAHVPFHPRAHDVPLCRHIVFTGRTHQIHHQQPCCQHQDRTADRLRILQIQRCIQIVQDLRKCQIDDADAKRTDHIKQKYLPVRTVIPDKFFHYFHSISPLSRCPIITRFSSKLYVRARKLPVRLFTIC